MEIYVSGAGEKSFKPDQIVMSINLSKVCKTNAQALLEGEQIVLNFLNLMQNFDFKKEDFKTIEYSVRDEVKYENGKSTKIGVRYSRGLRLKFDFDIEKMSKILSKSAKLDDAPRIRVDYALKDEKSAQAELFKDAYLDAKMQADMIADAAGLKVTKCLKASFSDDNEGFVTRASFERGMAKTSSYDVEELIAQTYTPNDITVKQNLYCVFVAE